MARMVWAAIRKMSMRKSALILAILMVALPGWLRGGVQAPVQTIEVHAHRFGFEPAEITVKAGQPVDLKLISDDVPHSLVIQELGVNEEAKKSQPGETRFTASQSGDYAGKCGRFCGSGHGHMVFTVHVVSGN